MSRNFIVHTVKEEFMKVVSHIEHIMPRDSYPSLFQNYDNIIVSCNDKHSCGMAKGNNYSKELINPVLENPLDYLEFNLANGEIIPKDSEEKSETNKRARYTINLLNLNYYKLKEARRNLIDILEVYKNNYDEEEISSYLKYFLDDGYVFPDLIKLYIDLSLKRQ